MKSRPGPRGLMYSASRQFSVRSLTGARRHPSARGEPAGVSPAAACAEIRGVRVFGDFGDWQRPSSRARGFLASRRSQEPFKCLYFLPGFSFKTTSSFPGSFFFPPNCCWEVMSTPLCSPVCSGGWSRSPRWAPRAGPAAPPCARESGPRRAEPRLPRTPSTPLPTRAVPVAAGSHPEVRGAGSGARGPGCGVRGAGSGSPGLGRRPAPRAAPPVASGDRVVVRSPRSRLFPGATDFRQPGGPRSTLLPRVSGSPGAPRAPPPRTPQS